MPQFGKKSLEVRATLHSKLQRVVDEAIKHVDFTILEGSRTLERQKELVAKGLSKTMNSKHIPPTLPVTHPEHNKSRAVDLALYPIKWDDRDGFLMFSAYIKGLAQGMGIQLRIGSDWNGDFRRKGQTFEDFPHIELLDSEI